MLTLINPTTKIHVWNTDTNTSICKTEIRFYQGIELPSPDEKAFYCKHCLASGLAQEAYDNYKKEKDAFEQKRKELDIKRNEIRHGLNKISKRLIYDLIENWLLKKFLDKIEIEETLYGTMAEFDIPEYDGFTIKIEIEYDPVKINEHLTVDNKKTL